MPEQYQQVTVTLPVSLVQKVDALKQQLAGSRSQVIRVALLRFFATSVVSAAAVDGDTPEGAAVTPAAAPSPNEASR